MRMTELQKMYHRARGRWSKNAGKEEQRKADFHAMREKKAFTPHMMYDPKTGKGYKAEKEAEKTPEATPAEEATPAPKAKTARKRVASVDIKEASSEEE